MTTTLAQLLNPMTVQQVFQGLLGVYQANGFPVDSWQVGGVERTRLMAMATELMDLSANYIPGITSGGFVDLAVNTNWMPLLADQEYNLEQNPATFTVGNITLTAASGSGPYSFAAGDLIAVFANSGNRYINTGSGTLTLSGSLVVPFRAEFAGAKYIDSSNQGALISLVTPLPGVTLNNPAGTYGSVSHVGAGTGTLSLSGSPVGPHQVVIRIDSSGQSGSAAWSYSLDGASFVSVGASGSQSNLGGTGIDVTLVNSAANPSFVLRDTYTFNTPGSWITSQGADAETFQALATRCKNRWSTLANVGVTQLYQLLATSTPGVGAQVTQVIVQPDTNINNKLNIVIAGPGGVLPSATVSAVQSFISARVPITVNPFVISPTPVNVSFGGTITCQASLLTAIQGAISTAITDYVAETPINGTLRIASLIELIMEVTGVIDAADITINGTSANFVLGSSTTFEIAEIETIGFDYVTV